MTASLLKTYPNNSFLREKLNTEQKQYRSTVKSKQKHHLNNLFSQLDNLHGTNPRGYMELVRAIREGSHDSKPKDDSCAVNSEEWLNHFSNLLGKSVNESQEQCTRDLFVQNNLHLGSAELDLPFTQQELLKAINKLKNNKSCSFDKVCNEMLKCGTDVLSKPLLELFKNIQQSCIYPSAWKQDIIQPLHKGGDKGDPNNFRVITVASNLGKLFNQLLLGRLDKFCVKNKIVGNSQLSGAKGSRTADHLLVVRFLIDKYVKPGKGKLYTCFVDLKKAYDSVNQSLLFFELLSEYTIGGNFLKILQEIYHDNQVYIKVSDGLIQLFQTTVGLQQGCVL